MKYADTINKLRDNINKHFIGKEYVVENVLVCMLAGGHILIEDVPGLGKTTLARVLAASVRFSYGRIQCTPDTLPSDITGVSIFNPKTSDFEYRAGVVMHQLLLVDEINRTTPKTQSSLLEAMAENQVTVDGTIYPLPNPFIVISTQNPVEFVGTYPLPEAQMDRFMMKLSVGYPTKEQEMNIAKQQILGQTSPVVDSICSAEDIINMKNEVAAVTVSDAVLSYIVDIVNATREDERFATGCSPRAMLALTKAAMAKAYLSSRDYVTPDDVKALVEPVLLHRLVLTTQARGLRQDLPAILKSVINKVKVPV